MRSPVIALSIAALLGASFAASGAEAASCRSRKTTGTVVGGVGGALVGNAIKGGGLGLVAGAVGGGLLGREVGKSGCRRTTYRSSARAVARPAPQPAAPTRVYYDRQGRAVSSPGAQAAAGVPAGTCRYETRSYYDSRGTLRSQQVQVCAR